MSRIDEPLIAQHRELADACAALEHSAQRNDWDAYRRRLDTLGAILERHLEFEEATLFPACEAQPQATPELVAGLRAEHAVLRRRLAVLRAAAPVRDPDGCRDELRALRTLLGTHIASEEELLYPACERLPQAQVDALAQRALRTAAPPERAEGVSLDVRGLEPPEPMLRILDGLRRAGDRALLVRIHREPFPLYEVLHEQGYRWRTRALEDGSYEIVIERTAA